MIRWTPIRPRRDRLGEAARQIDGRIPPIVRRYGGELVSRMRRYPPQQPTRYVRTGRLGQGWEMRIEAGGGSVIVFNRVTYMRWVQGRNQTAVMARRNWQRLTDEAQTVARSMQAEVRRALR